VTRSRRTNEILEGDREAERLGLVLGTELRAARRRARLTQAELGEQVGLRRSRVGELERGLGTSATLRNWIRLGMAIGRPLAVAFSRDLSMAPEPADAGHLAAQEIVLGLAARSGRRVFFELPSGASAAPGVIDVAVRDDRQLVLILIEIWNRLMDLGAGARSTSRKVAAVEVSKPSANFRVASCWLLVDNAANRAIVRRFPEIFRARFPGSSGLWVRALIGGEAPPREPGVAWVDPRTGRITELRHRA
jgi:transcriptional regulator with XRE-family HTH domain